MHHAPLLAALILAAVTTTAFGDLGRRTALLNEPFQEWSIPYPGTEGDPYDVVAYATFTHQPSGRTRRSLMFYSGDADIWKFRFTGVEAGEWRIATTGPGALGGHSGVVLVEPAPTPRHGFLVGRGRAWVWRGSGRPAAPQFVMAPSASTYWRDGRVDVARIDADIREFVVETGLSGFHFENGGRWWNLTAGRPTADRPHPDPRTFEVYEQFLLRAYPQGAAIHFWLYGSDAYGGNSGNRGIGGPLSPIEQRMLRYIAARLGPIPGWSMGYGFDIHKWADAAQLQAWYEYVKEQLGGWEHIIGARADNLDWFNADGSVRRTPLSDVYWSGDYVGYYHYRVGYAWYAQCFDSLDKPHFQEDRFRIRTGTRWDRKDYTPQMTRRGLWHAMMAGGVANIWGNLLGGQGNTAGSMPFSNNARGEIQGNQFTVNIKEQIRTHRAFWFDANRFTYDYVRDNALTDNRIDGQVMRIDAGDAISVCLRDREHRRYVFYSEQASAVRMDLSHSPGPLPAVAVDAARAYVEIPLGNLEAGEQTWQAPYPSDWAIAVGVFPTAWEPVAEPAVGRQP